MSPLFALLAAPAFGLPIFPAQDCSSFPAAPPEAAAAIAQVDPKLAGGLRELPAELVLALTARAVALGKGSIELLTDDGFRGECAFYLSQATLHAVDDRYDLELITVIRGVDKKKRPFSMLGMWAGRGRTHVLYDRDGVRFRHPAHERDFKLSRWIHLSMPRLGRYEDMRGILVPVFLLGDLEIRAVEVAGGKLQLDVGGFGADSQLRPIRPRRMTLPEAVIRPDGTSGFSVGPSFEALRRWALP